MSRLGPESGPESGVEVQLKDHDIRVRQCLYGIVLEVNFGAILEVNW